MMGWGRDANLPNALQAVAARTRCSRFSAGIAWRTALARNQVSSTTVIRRSSMYRSGVRGMDFDFANRM
jgi:outer membrane receptor for Fe3+-dicitrate